MSTANPFISTVKAGRTLATPPNILIATLTPDLYHEQVNTLDGPNYH